MIMKCNCHFKTLYTTFREEDGGGGSFQPRGTDESKAAGVLGGGWTGTCCWVSPNVVLLVGGTDGLKN